MKITFQSYYAMGFHAALDKEWIWVNFVQSVRSDLSSITEPDHGILTNTMTCMMLLVYSRTYHLGTIVIHSVSLVQSLNQTQVLMAPSILSSTGRPKSPCVTNNINLRHFSLYTHNNGVIRNIYILVQ